MRLKELWSREASAFVRSLVCSLSYFVGSNPSLSLAVDADGGLEALDEDGLVTEDIRGR